MSDEVTVKLILIDTAAWLTDMLAAAARIDRALLHSLISHAIYYCRSTVPYLRKVLLYLLYLHTEYGVLLTTPTAAAIVPI